MLLKMKIINIDYLTVSRIPTEKAHGHQILEMCQALSKIENVNLYLNLPNRYNHLLQNIEEWYGEKFSIKIRKINTTDFFGKNLHSKYLQLLNFYIINVTYALNFFFKSIRKSKNNQYYYVREPLLLTMVILLIKFKKAKIIYELHSLPESKILRYIFCLLLKNVCLIIVLTPILKKILQVIYNLDSQKIIYLSDSVNKRFLNIKLKEDSTRKILKICYLGRVSSKNVPKGLNDLLNVISQLNITRQIEFHIYGVLTNEVNELNEYISKLKILKNIKIYVNGNIKYSQVPILLSKFNILVGIYSKNDFHNKYCVSPLKVFEYMSAGKLILISQIPAFKRVLEHNENALLFKNSRISMKNCFEKAIANYEDLRYISMKAKSDAESNTWELRALKLIYRLRN